MEYEQVTTEYQRPLDHHGVAGARRLDDLLSWMSFPSSLQVESSQQMASTSLAIFRDLGVGPPPREETSTRSKLRACPDYQSTQGPNQSSQCTHHPCPGPTPTSIQSSAYGPCRRTRTLPAYLQRPVPDSIKRQLNTSQQLYIYSAACYLRTYLE